MKENGFSQRRSCFIINFSAVIIALLAAQLFAGEPDTGKSWSSWRGPNGDFTLEGTGTFGSADPFELKVVWRKEIGTGYSGLSVDRGMLITMFSDNIFDYVAAMNAETGEELWRTIVDSTLFGHAGSETGPISTPLISGEHVIAIGPKGRLVALDATSGKLHWSTDLVKDHGSVKPFYGFTTSPVIWEELVLVSTGGDRDNAMTAFNIRSGEVVWTAGSDTVDYQSPTLFNLNGEDQVITIGNRRIYGLLPKTGELKWRLDYGGDTHPTGAPANNIIFVDKDKFFIKEKRNESRLLQLKWQESGQIALEELWTSDAIKISYVVPVYHDGYIFGHSTRVLNAIDVKSGETVWKSRQPGDGFPIVVDGHLIIITKKGKLSIAPAAGDGFNEITSMQIFDDLVWTNPSFVDGRLYLRSFGEIAVVEIARSSGAGSRVTDINGVMPETAFGQFITRLNQSDAKSAMIDEFMSAQKSFPVIEEGSAHIVYRGEAEDIALISDATGYRIEPSMNRVEGTDFYYFSLPLETDAKISYGFNRNYSEYISDTLNTGPVHRNRDGSALSSLEMPKWSRPAHLGVDESITPGRIDSLIFTSEHFEGENKLRLYIPAAYEASDKPVSVAYYHGGTAPLSAGNWPTSLDNLVNKTVEPLIVVFISGIYIDTPEYGELIAKELVPLIDRTYRTRTNRESRANLGHVYAAVDAAYITATYPELFSKLGAQAAFYSLLDDATYGKALSNHSNPMIAYVDWGKYGVVSPLEGFSLVASSRMLFNRLKEGGHTVYGGQVNEGHGWENWKNRTDKMFEALFPLAR